MKLFISAHNDDETLFGAFTLMRKHPLVVIVTDSWKQFNRGLSVTAEIRWKETLKAMEILNCPVYRMGIRDDIIDEWMVRDRLSRFVNFTDDVYAPAIQGGNPDHDLIGRVAKELFPTLRAYATYSDKELYTTGYEEVKPDYNELAKKEAALMCYESQLNLPETKPHFEAVKGRSEWFI